MTKAELIEAMKDFPDEMEIMLRVEGGYEPLRNVSTYEQENYESQGVDNYILLKDLPCYEESDYQPIS